MYDFFYQNHFQATSREYFFNYIPVFKPYKIKSVKVKGEAKKIIYGSAKEVTAYNPLKGKKMESIINHIEKIDPENEKDIIDFCNKFGLLAGPYGLDYVEKNGVKCLDELEDLDYISSYDYLSPTDYKLSVEKTNQILFDPKTVNQWRKKDQRFNFTIHKAPIIQTIAGFKNRLSSCMEILKNMNEENYHCSKFSDNISFLYKDVGLRAYSKELRGGQNIIVPVMNYYSLTQALGIYFLESAMNDLKFRVCKNKECPDKYFIPSKANQVYCCKTCKNLVTQRDYRKRQAKKVNK